MVASESQLYGWRQDPGERTVTWLEMQRSQKGLAGCWRRRSRHLGIELDRLPV